MSTTEERQLEALEKELEKVKKTSSQYVFSEIFVVVAGLLGVGYINAQYSYATDTSGTSKTLLVFIGILLLATIPMHRGVNKKRKEIEERIKKLESSPTIAAKKASETYLSDLQNQMSRASAGPKRDLLAARIDEVKTLELRREASELRGYDKYLCNVEEALKRHEGFDQVEGYLANQYRLAANARADTHDPYIWGGMANGLAGPAAGLATALQTAQENAVAEAKAANTRANAAGNYRSGLESVGVLRSGLPSKSTLERTKKEVAQHRIERTGEAEYFDSLRFEPDYDGASVTKGGSLKIDILISCKSIPYVVSQPAAVDGALRVVALVDGQEFAVGYLIGHAIGETDISKVGLSSGTKARRNPVLLVPTSADKSFSSSTRYELSYEPVHVWAIQQ